MSFEPPFNNRSGQFRITSRLIDQDPKFVMEVMAYCVIVRAELVYYSNEIEYQAYSPCFAICPEGNSPPWYTWTKIEDMVVCKRDDL